MQSLNRFELRTYWTPDAITSDMEIRTDKATYAIGGVVNVDELNEEYLITATKTNG